MIHVSEQSRRRDNTSSFSSSKSDSTLMQTLAPSRLSLGETLTVAGLFVHQQSRSGPTRPRTWSADEDLLKQTCEQPGWASRHLTCLSSTSLSHTCGRKEACAVEPSAGLCSSAKCELSAVPSSINPSSLSPSALSLTAKGQQPDPGQPSSPLRSLTAFHPCVLQCGNSYMYKPVGQTYMRTIGIYLVLRKKN